MRRKIDIVYTWVNVNDSEFTKQLGEYLDEDTPPQQSRLRDIHDTLRYSIRSIEKYAPWVNKIHIVTQRPQVPDWLKLDHPMLQIVHHDEFIPPQYLPTYNPRVIQSFFHEIPNSSEHLIYFNDDYLLGNNISEEDFISEDGRLKVYGSIFGIPLWFRVYAQKNQIKGLPRLEHTPFIIFKPWWKEMLTIKETELEQTRKSRFREKSNVRVDRLYRYYLLSKKRKNISAVNFHNLLKISMFHRITDDLSQQIRGLNQVSTSRPKFLCLNDDQSNEPNGEVIKLIEDFLKAQYSEPSSFENTSIESTLPKAK
ncbi:MAG: hypothetical protein RIF46_11520 [Cyclobacteriaceae bacterium]